MIKKLKEPFMEHIIFTLVFFVVFASSAIFIYYSADFTDLLFNFLVHACSK